jgi:hypothetical protein
MASKLPNLLIAGVTKAGTTSLYAYLVQHPSICGSDGKGTGYFEPLRYGDGRLPPTREYERHFRHCGGEPYRLEATLSYCHGGHRMIEAIEGVLDEPRIILSLRDPVGRLWSSYKMKKSKVRLARGETFESFLDTCEELLGTDQDRLPENEVYHSLRAGLYADFVPQWMDAFGDRLRVVFFEHLAEDPAVVVGGLCRWLGIDATAVDSFDYTVRNETVLHRSERLRTAAKAVNAASWRLLRPRPRLYGLVRKSYERVNGRPFEEQISGESRRRLQGFYSSSNQALAQYLEDHGYGAFPGWLTDEARSHDRVAGVSRRPTSP